MADSGDAEPITRLVDHVFALAGALAREGDRIAAPDGLNASRWLVLGAIADGPLSPAAIARRRGLQRQSVRESVLALEESGFVVRRPSTDRRTFLVELTAKGRDARRRIEPRRAAWAEATAGGIPARDLEVTVATLALLREQLGTRERADPQA